MTIALTLRHPSGAPFGVGEKIELLGDGQVLAAGIVDDHGQVTFETAVEDVERLAVRASPRG